MSRRLKYPINIPENVEIQKDHREVTVKGPLGTSHWTMAKGVDINVEDGQAYVLNDQRTDPKGNLAGTERTIISNMVTGVSQGFERKLELNGVGYRAQLKGDQLELNVGHSHLDHFKIPDDVTIEVPTQTQVVVKGINKQSVGQAAAEIRRIRPPEPYKGKGIRYEGERIIQKEGKK